MARQNIPMVINLRQNKNAENAAYGKYFPEVDTKEPLNLKGLAAHMAEHNKVSTYEMSVLVLGEMVTCMIHLLKEGQPIKLDGLGTISPSVDAQGKGMDTIAEAVAKGAENLINGIHLVFTPENTKGEKLTSRAFKKECLFEWGYLVESEKRTVNGKERRVQNKTPLSYILAPQADGTSPSQGGSQATTVATPTISGETPFSESTQVTMSGPDGAEIRYTTDGSTPTAESTLYSEPVTLSASATVKAIAVKNGTSSEVASKEFTKESGGNETIPSSGGNG